MQQILDSARIALQAIWANKLRSLLTVLGNVVAVTSIVTVVSLIQGMNAYVTDTIVSGVGVDQFTIQRMPVVRTEADEERVRNNPRIKLTEATAIAGSPSSNVNTQLSRSLRVMGKAPTRVQFAARSSVRQIAGRVPPVTGVSRQV